MMFNVAEASPNKMNYYIKATGTGTGSSTNLRSVNALTSTGN
jgi:hypothetical protein